MEIGESEKSRLGSNYLIPFPIDRNSYGGIIPRRNLYMVSRLFCNIAAWLSPGTDVIDAFTSHVSLATTDCLHYSKTLIGVEPQPAVRLYDVYVCVCGRCVHTVIGTFGSCSQRYDDNGSRRGGC